MIQIYYTDDTNLLYLIYYNVNKTAILIFQPLRKKITKKWTSVWVAKKLDKKPAINI